MRRATPSLPVTPAMFRHFAVLTIVITSCIGIFASGENRELVQQQIEAQSRPAKANPAKPGQAAAPKVIGGLNIAAGTRLGSAAGGGGDYVESGSEVSGGGGGSGSGSSDVVGSSAVASGYAAPTQAPAIQPTIPTSGTAPPPPGSPLGTKTNMRGGPLKAQPLRQPTGEEIERMMAASRERSAAAD